MERLDTGVKLSKIKKLPSGLKFLEIKDVISKSMIKNLPSGLESLHIIVDDFKLLNKIKNFPPNLKNLVIGKNDSLGSCQIDRKFISLLPKSIESMTIQGFITEDLIGILPPNLSSCNVFIGEEKKELIFY